ncbi:MAG: drug resistance transporter, EmrB/QacA subfamily [Actinomycetia bacterium]|nr:drug resistance transporter, EmrB/QacA subfamily [Actinomycetes bacterium]
MTVSNAANAPTGAPPDPRRWWTLAVLCLSLILIVAGNSSLNVSLPQIQEGLHTSSSSIQWIVDVYSLVFAGLLLPAGALADRYGRKTALQFGLVVFGLASLISSFADAAWQLILLRAIMGLGAAFIMPGTLSILTNVFPPGERPRAISIWAGFAGFGGVLGTVASGLLLVHFAWGAIFLVNVPIVLLALGAGVFLVPNSKDPKDTVLDPPGALLAVAGLAVLLFGVIQAPEHGWLSPSILAALIGGALLLTGFVVFELRTPEPMLDIRLFKIRPFSVGSGTITLQYFALYGLFFVIAQYFQLAQGYSPLKAALATFPLGFFSMIGAPISAGFVRRRGARVVVGTGLLVTAFGFVLLSRVTASTPFLYILVAEILIGTGVGQTTAPSTTLIMSSVRMAKAGIGSAVNDTSREVGGALGIAVMGSIVSSVYRSRIGEQLVGLPPNVARAARHSAVAALQQAKSAGASSPQLVHAARGTFADAFGTAMLAGALMLLVAAAAVWRFQDRHGSPGTGDLPVSPQSEPAAGA